MSDCPVTPGGRSRRQKTPLHPEFAARMRAIQEREKASPPESILLLPTEEGFLEDGTPVTAKFIRNARDPVTDLPQYAIIDRSSAEALRRCGDLDIEWRLHKPAGREYVQIRRKQKFLKVPDRIFELATGCSAGRNQAVVIADGNIADLRLSNLEVVPKSGTEASQGVRLHWEKTPLDDATYERVKAEQLRLENERVSRIEIRHLPFIYGHLADGTPIAIKFVTSPYPHHDTGLRRYVIVDADVAQNLEAEQDPREPWGWSLSFGKYGTKPPRLAVTKTNMPQAARVIFELGNPGAPIQRGLVVSAENCNPLDLRLANLALKPRKTT